MQSGITAKIVKSVLDMADKSAAADANQDRLHQKCATLYWNSHSLQL